jgi:hypothetical protein
MYNTAKRGVAFAVATGGLLLTGPGYASADAAAEVGVPGAPVTAAADVAAQGTVRVGAAGLQSPLPGRAAVGALAAQAAAARISAATGDVLSGNSVNLPVSLGANVCGNEVAVTGVATDGRGCTAARPAPAAAAATRSARPGGVLSGNTVLAPINVPVNLCGNIAAVAALAGGVRGAGCSTPAAGQGASTAGADLGAGAADAADAVGTPTKASAALGGLGIAGLGGLGVLPALGVGGVGLSAVAGDLLSGNTVNVPINVPVNVCGNTVAAVAATTSAAVTCSYTTGVSMQSQSVSMQPAQNTSTSQSAETSPSTASSGTVMPVSGSPDTAAQTAAAPNTPVPNTPVPNTASSSAVSMDTTTPASPASACGAQLPINPPAAPAVVTTPLPAAPAVAALPPIEVHPEVIWPRPELPQTAVAAAVPQAEPHAQTVAASAHIAPHAVPMATPGASPEAASEGDDLADPPAGSLAHTGAEALFPLGATLAALTGGVGLRASGRRRRT